MNLSIEPKFRREIKKLEKELRLTPYIRDIRIISLTCLILVYKTTDYPKNQNFLEYLGPSRKIFLFRGKSLLLVYVSCGK